MIDSKRSKRKTYELHETRIGVARHEALKAAASHIKRGNTVCARMLLIAVTCIDELLSDPAKVQLGYMETLCTKFEEAGSKTNAPETAKKNHGFLNTAWSGEIGGTINSAKGSGDCQRALAVALLEMVWGMYLVNGMFDELTASFVKVRKRSHNLFAAAYRELRKDKSASRMEEAGERFLVAKALFKDLLATSADPGSPTEMEKLLGDPRDSGMENSRQGKETYFVVQRQKYII